MDAGGSIGTESRPDHHSPALPAGSRSGTGPVRGARSRLGGGLAGGTGGVPARRHGISSGTRDSSIDGGWSADVLRFHHGYHRAETCRSRDSDVESTTRTARGGA